MPAQERTLYQVSCLHDMLVIHASSLRPPTTTHKSQLRSTTLQRRSQMLYEMLFDIDQDEQAFGERKHKLIERSDSSSI
eukprot:scaffold225508_cov22-Tisochrysis_lutea.AAC.1